MNKVFIPEKCDKELHQVHDAAVLREGDLWKKRRKVVEIFVKYHI